MQISIKQIMQHAEGSKAAGRSGCELERVSVVLRPTRDSVARVLWGVATGGVDSGLVAGVIMT